MGFFDSLFGGGKKTQVEQTTLPDWFNAANESNLATASQLGANFLLAPNFSIAGFNPDELQGMDFARENVTSAFTDPSLNAGSGQVTGASIRGMANPYTDQVVDASLAGSTKDLLKASADLGSRLASASPAGYGSANAALAQGQLAGDWATEAGKLRAGLKAAAFDKAAELAAGNATRGITAASTQSALRDAELNRRRATVTDLLATGGMQRDLTQAGLDQGWTTLARMKSMLPTAVEQTKTTTSKGGSSVGSNLVKMLLGA